MRPSDVDDHLKNWWAGSTKIYKYIRFGPMEFVCIKKNNESEFECDAEKSTLNLGKKTVSEMKALLENNELVYMEPMSYQRDGHFFKTNGCTCGAWAVKDSGHSNWCDKANGSS